MLESLQLVNFKAYRDVEVPLQPFTVVVGPNGSGKTSLLQAVELLGGLVRGSLDEALQARQWTLSSLRSAGGTGGAIGLRSTLTLDGALRTWDIELHKRKGNYIAREEVAVAGESVLLRSGRHMERLDEESGEWEAVTQSLQSSWLSTVDEEDAGRFPDLLPVATWARSIAPLIELTPALLRRPSRRTESGIGATGESLAGFLRHLRDRHPDRFAAVVRRVKNNYERFQDLTIRAPAAGWNRLEITERWGRESGAFSAMQVSDGLLRLLAISASIEVQPSPSILMFDEIENGVHPSLLGGLMGLLQDLAAEGRTQVIVTTHSPVALEYLRDPASMLVCARNPRGHAQLVPLSTTEGFGLLGSIFKPGELWLNLGERDLIKRPRLQAAAR